jgi:hypothetical protein
MPLEEIGALFNDGDEIAIYQSQLEIDLTTHTIHEQASQYHELYEVPEPKGE